MPKTSYEGLRKQYEKCCQLVVSFETLLVCTVFLHQNTELHSTVLYSTNHPSGWRTEFCLVGCRCRQGPWRISIRSWDPSKRWLAGWRLTPLRRSMVGTPACLHCLSLHRCHLSALRLPLLSNVMQLTAWRLLLMVWACSDGHEWIAC